MLLDVGQFTDEDEREAMEDRICVKDEEYLSDLMDGVLPTIGQLIKTAEKFRPAPTPPPPDPGDVKCTPSPDKDITPTAWMAKLKLSTFPAIYGNIDDSKNLSLICHAISVIWSFSINSWTPWSEMRKGRR